MIKVKSLIDFFDGRDHVLRTPEKCCMHCGGGPKELPVLWNTQTQLIRHVHCEDKLKKAGIFSYIPDQFYNGEDERVF